MMTHKRILVGLVLSVAVVIALGCGKARKLELERMQSLEAMARSFMDQTDEAIASQLETVKGWARSPELAEVLGAPQSATPPAIFSSWIKQDPANRVLLLTTSEGVVVAETSQFPEAEQSPYILPPVNERRLWELTWFNRLVEQEEPCVADVSYRPFSHEGDLTQDELDTHVGLPVYLTFASPVQSSPEGGPAGVLILAQSWDKWYEMGQNFETQQSKQGYETLRVVLMNQDNFVLLHPKKDRVLQKRMVHSPAVRDALSGNEGSRTEFLDQESEEVGLVGYAPSDGFGDYGGLGWAALMFEKRNAALKAK